MDLQQALTSFDIAAFCKRHGGKKETPSPYTYEWLFPDICGSARLRYNAKKQTWICWGCNSTGSLVGLVERLEECDLNRALEIILDGYVGGDSKIEGIDLSLVPMHCRPQVRFLPEMPWPENVELLSPSMPQPHMRAWEYLMWRGITPEQVMQYRIGYSRVGRLKDYVVFPMWMDRALVYYQARATWDPPRELEGDSRREWIELTGYRKTLNPPSKEDGSQAHGHEVLFNYDRAGAFDWVIVCEGPVDAIKAGDNAVALIGKDPNPIKLERLSRLPARTYVVYLDYGATESAEKVAKELHQFGDVWIASPPPGRDPGDLTREQNAVCIQQATKYQPGTLNLQLA